MAEQADSAAAWSYHEAFSRNLGLITPEEQERLRNSRVAIAGMGGIGGIDAVTLARLGVGRFTIADPECFDVVNTNRQYGAACSAMGKPKADVMADILRDINPEADIRVFSEPIGNDNASDFLRDADLFIDALEFFEIETRQCLFRLAASNNMFAITGGPVGFSAIWIIFDPAGMSFDSYFDFSDHMEWLDKLVALGIGVAPKGTHRSYMDLKQFRPEERRAPSSIIACQLAAGALACEAMKILIERGRVRAAPYYHQFDPYMGRFVCRRLWHGNRHPVQRMKRWALKRLVLRHSPAGESFLGTHGQSQ